MSLTPAEKYECVKSLIRGKSLAKVAKGAGVSEATLEGWRERCEKACLAVLKAGGWGESDRGRNWDALAIGGKIRLFRLLEGYTQARFARAVGGISREDLVDYELGRRRPGEDSCRGIAEALSLDVRFLDFSIASPRPKSLLLERVVLFSLRSPLVEKTAIDQLLNLLSPLFRDSDVKEIYSSGDDYMLLLEEGYVFLRCYGRGPAVSKRLEAMRIGVRALNAGTGQNTKDEQAVRDLLGAYARLKLIALDIDSLLKSLVVYGGNTERGDREKSMTLRAIYDLMREHDISKEDIADAIANKAAAKKQWAKNPSSKGAEQGTGSK